MGIEEGKQFKNKPIGQMTEQVTVDTTYEGKYQEIKGLDFVPGALSEKPSSSVEKSNKPEKVKQPKLKIPIVNLKDL